MHRISLLFLPHEGTHHLSLSQGSLSASPAGEGSMQRRAEMESLDDPCDICGDFGYGELIVTCSSCPNREHIYCMAPHLPEVPEDWSCNFCQPSDHADLSTSHLQEGSIGMVPSPSSREVPHREAYPKRERIAKTSKVVYLSAEEVIKLASRERMTSSRSHTCLKPKVSASHIWQNPLKSKAALKSTVREYGNQHLVSSDGKKSLSGKKVLVQQPEKHTGEEQFMDIDEPSFEREASIRGKEEPMKSKSPNSPSRYSQPLTKSGGDKGAVAESGYSFEEIRFLHYVLPKLKLCLPYLPALSARWSGSLKFLGDSSYFFRAHPPCNFHRKANELLLKMPKEIHMEQIPLSHILKDIFQNEGPDMGDIGLYFYPADNVDRHIAKYSALVQLMVCQEFSLRGVVDGAELLLFTSKELHVDSHLFIVGFPSEYFLWGIFRGAKSTLDRKSLYEELNVHPPLSVGDHQTTGHRSGYKSSAIDRMTRSGNLSRYTSKGAGTSREGGTIGEIALPATNLVGSFQEHAQDVGVDPGAANHPSSPLVENIGCPAFNANRKDTCERINVSSGVKTPKQPNQKVKVEVEDITIDTHDIVKRSPAKLLPKMEKPDEKFGSLELGNSFNNKVMLNASGIYREITGFAGAGGTVHTSSGKWVFGYSLRLGKWSSLGADLWAIFQGLKLVWDRGFREVLLVSDSDTALKCLEKVPQSSDPHIDLIQGCRDLMLRNWHCIVNHISREQNVAAAWLADHSEQYTLGLTELSDPPVELARILENRYNGIPLPS